MQKDIKKEIKNGYLEVKRHSIIARELGMRTIDVTNMIKQYEHEWIDEKIARNLPSDRCNLCGSVVYREDEWLDLGDVPTRDFSLSNSLAYLCKKARFMFAPEQYKNSVVCVGCAVRFAEQHIFDGYYQDKMEKLKRFEEE